MVPAIILKIFFLLSIFYAISNTCRKIYNYYSVLLPKFTGCMLISDITLRGEDFFYCIKWFMDFLCVKHCYPIIIHKYVLYTWHLINAKSVLTMNHHRIQIMCDITQNLSGKLIKTFIFGVTPVKLQSSPPFNEGRVQLYTTRGWRDPYLWGSLEDHTPWKW